MVYIRGASAHILWWCGILFLALLDFVRRATVVAQASVVRCLSVNSGFSETAAWIQAKFCGKLLIRHLT